MLNAYGRSLSRELLSQKSLFGKQSSENDEQFAMGLADLPSWLEMGGNIRLLQTFVESKQASKGRFLIMQVDLDFLFHISKKIKSFISLGRIESSKPEATVKDFAYIPRWGFDFSLSPEDQVDQWGFRLGRFLPAYGIYFSEHTFVTRSLLEFGPGQERYAGELSLVNDQYTVLATGIWGQASGLTNKFEQGGVLQVMRAVGEKSKLGLNYYQTERELGELKYTRKIYGAVAYMGFTSECYGLLEVNQPFGSDEKAGLMDVFKLGYEIFQGFQIFATQEYANLNTEKSDPKFEAYGIGAQWFPRTHWDLYGVYRREKNTALDKDYQDVVWLIGHFYL